MTINEIGQQFFPPRQMRHTTNHADLARLKQLETRIANAIWDVNGVVYPADAKEADRLRRLTGMSWDPVNCKWKGWIEDFT